jgi:F0F1-type ATP synthase membrane subunit b/b'
MNGIIFLSGTSDKGDPMKNPIKIAASVLISFMFMISAPMAFANTTNEYNQKVAEAQAKINDLQNELNNAQENLESWMNSSNEQANLINDAQTAATQAEDALNEAANDYALKKNDYDSWYNNEVRIAEEEVVSAVNEVSEAADLVDVTYNNYFLAQSNADNAQAQMNQAQIDYDTKLINDGGAGTPAAGLVVDIYTGISRYGNPPQRSNITYTLCKTVTVSNINIDWGGGNIFGCGSDYVMLNYRGYITYPTTTKVYFQAPADDGFYMSINGQQIINDWSLKGCGANSTGMFSFTGGKSYAIDAWFYEWSGGACSTLNYRPITSNSYSVAPASFFTQGAVANLIKNPALLAILNNKIASYVQAVAVEEQANEVYLDAEDNYDGKYLNYIMLSQDLAGKNSILNQLEIITTDSENNWQICSDDKAVKDADLRDLKAEYGSTFNAIETAALRVDDLEAKLAQAKIDLKNIPKPTAAEKRKPKKVTPKPMADGAYVPRPTFAPVPK